MKTPLKTRLFLVVILTLFPVLAPAANLTWDANPALTGAQDGSGTWDTSTATWWTGTADAAFNNVTPDVPTFGSLNGAAGTVTLGANIVAGNITFNAPSVGYYTIAGGGFTLSLTNRTITANVNATISANLVPGSASSGLTLANSAATAPSAVLTLSGNNTYTNFNLGPNAANTTAAVRVGSSTAFGWGNIGVAGGQGSATSHRIELAGSSLTITNSISNLGRNNNSAVVVNLGSGNTMSGMQTKTTGGQDTHWESEVAGGLTFSGAASGGIAFASGASAPRYFVLRGTGGGTVSGVISNNNSSSLGIVKAGSGTWTLAGQNYYTNLTIVDEGTLTLDYSVQNNSKLADNFALFLGGGALNLNGGSHTEVVGSTTIGAGNSSVTRASGTSTLRMNTITRNRGGTVNFGAASIADCDVNDVNGILGGYATINGANWAHTTTSGAADTAITAYAGYTDIAASGSTLADAAASNVRLNSAGGGGNIVSGAATTEVDTLLQNTTTAATIDASTGILRLGAIGGVLLPSTAQSLTIGTAANSGTLTAGGAANTAGEIILINNSGSDILVNSVIADNGTGGVSLTKAGSGTATLAGSNTHTGTNSIVGGTLNISSDANLGAVPGAATPSSILINGGTLNATADVTLSANRGIALGPTSRYGNGTIGVASGKTFNVPSIIASADLTGNGPGGSLTKTGNGTLALGGVNTYANGTIINAGTVSITASTGLGAQPGCYIPDHLVINGGTLEAAAGLTLGAARGILLGPIGGSGSGTLQADDSMILQLDSRIADNWNGTGSLIKTGNGTLIVTSPFNDYSGNTTVSAGIFQANNSRSIPNGAGKGNVTVNGTLNINGVSVAINGLSGSGTVDNIQGTGMTFSVGNNDQTSSFGGTIQNSGGGPLALSKAGSGTLTLSGIANHTGSTLVTAGTLALTGSATISSTTNIAVSSTATFNVAGLTGGTLTLSSGQVLSGNGSVLGTINTGTGALAPGASAGTLTVANLTLGSGSSVNYDLANVTTTGGGVNDYTIVSGTLTVAGPCTLNLNYLNALPATSGKYTLFSYNIFSGNVTDISVPSGFTINNNTVAKTIELLINHVPANLTWVGDGSGNVWDLDTTPNWTAGALFFNGDTANFDNSGSSTPAINITVPVIASAVNVSGTQNYDFIGSSVSSASLTKSGGGTLTLENDNTYATGVLISGGTVQIGNNGSTGTLTGGNITNNGAIVVNRSGDVVLGSAISGSGSVSQMNTGGTSALSASNSYAGVTFVSAGRLYPRNPAAFGLTSSGTTVSTDAQIYMDQNINFGAEPLVLNGNGLNGGGDGALRKGGGGVTVFGGPITLESDTTINVDGGATLNLTNGAGITSSGTAHLILTGGSGSAGTVSGPIVLGTGGGILTKTGSSSWTLGGSNSMSLATIDNGTLILANTNALGTNLNVVLTSTTGGAGLTGTRLTLSGGISLPANRSLTMPSSGVGTVRSAFVGTGAVTNTWAGPVTLTGDSAGSGNVLGFGVDANSTFILSGNVTADATFLGGKLLIRGNATGLGYLLGTVALDPVAGQIQVDDGSTWILGSSANTWQTTIFAGSSTIRLGVNNGLPTATLLSVGNGTANRLDLAGFNQQVAGMDAAGLNITNTSASADCTLIYSSAGATTFGGTISDGAKKLNLTVAAGTLFLTNPPTLNLTHSTISVAGGGAILDLNYIGTNQVSALILNGVSQPAGFYNSVNAAPYIADTGVLSVVPAGPSIFTNSTGITSFSLNGTNIVLTATNGQSGAAYYLLDSTNVTLPLNQWKTVATNVLSANGNYTFTGTNVVTPGGQQQFYILSNTNY